ncbi:MAG: glycine oxidase ThiO [Marinobacterium sp.]|nr:glycine oxidase ThiO [Marinobacterium sp.]
MADFIVIGGGVIGMMTARELAQSGANVTLLERRQCAQESSWAGGGIVSPLYPWRYRAPITRLATWSQSSYIHLADELIDETGYDPELRQKGMFMLSVDDEAEALNWAQEFHRPLRKVDGDFVYRKEPNLAAGVESAIWMPEVASIRNPRLGRSLRQAMLANPHITLVEQADVTGLIQKNERICGARTSAADYYGGATIIAGGAWSPQLLTPLGIELPVEPVHGQMMLYRAEPGLIDRVVLADGRYLIPRNDGRILVGSTLERIGFEKRTTEEARASLQRTALSIMPTLQDYPVEHHWSGLRPGSPEGIPYIGAVPGYDGLWVNAGQFRNGLVLAPASTRLLSDLLLGREPVVNPEPYQLSGRVIMR